MAALGSGLGADNYTVAWISAIQKEYLIACATLDEEHDAPIDIENDNNCYTFGRIGEHNVVLASLPMARVGITQAGMLASEMLRSFPKLRFGLMVGIAGGAPTEKNDIRLGDLVVSIPDDHKRLGGVVHYGFGATDQRQGFQRRGILNAPPEILLNATSKLKTKHERQGHGVHQQICQVIDKHAPLLDNYKRPSRETDTLYKSTFVHPEGAGSCSEVCINQNGAAVTRSERPGDPEQPVIHYGTIGSADNLMKDASLRDQLASTDGILCFEMEAAGLMNGDLRCIVIRGICDYSDTHKNDVWQEYAAAAAAIYAKELLGVVRATKNRRIGTFGVMNLLTGTKPSVLDALNYEGKDDKQEYSMPEAIYYYDWVWKTDFPTWLSTSDRPFWVSGKPGSGKSALMAYLVHSKETLDKLKSHDPSYWIVHFHFDYRAGKNLPNNIYGMYRSLLYQLADHDENVKERLTKLLSGGRLRVNSQPKLLDAMCEAVAVSGHRLCIFIDGLDEFEGDLIEVIHVSQLMMQRMPVKFCLASRPDIRIPDTLDLWSQLTMQDLNEASMREYVKRKLFLKSATNTTIVKRFSPNLTKYLVRRAQGILLWFKLAVDMVVDLFDAGASNDDIIDLVRAVPDGLDAVYERILDLIPPGSRSEVALILFLTDNLRSMSKWTEQGITATMDFATTNMDHFWGAYDFILDQLGEELQITRLESHEELQTRTRQLLQGLVEFAPSRVDGATMVDFFGEIGLNVRFVHETFSAFITRDGWIDRYLPETFKSHFSKSFWLGFSANLIKTAAVERMILPPIMDAAVEELSLWFESLSGEDSSLQSGFKNVSRFLTHHAHRPYSLVLALHFQFCPLRESPLYMSPDDLILQGIATSRAPNVEFPPAWKRRHIIIRTALFLLIDLAAIHEDLGTSSYPIISEAMQCHLNPILAYCIFMSGRESLDRKLLLKLQKDHRLMPVMDAYLAVKGNLKYYFRDRLAFTTISDYQKDFLFQSVLSHPTASQIPSVQTVKVFLSSLANIGRFVQQRDLCFLMRNTKCWQTASDLALALMTYLAPETSQEAEWQSCCRLASGEKVGLLFHWARTACESDCRCSNGPLRATADYSMVLQLLLLHEANIHADCYPGGSVFQALLDPSIGTPVRQGLGLNRKAKFLALIEHGFDPTVPASNGETALQSAISAFKSWGKHPRLYEINSIIGYIRFYDIYSRWPEEESETLDLCQTAFELAMKDDQRRAMSLQSSQSPDLGSETDISSPELDSTVRRRSAQRSGSSGLESTDPSEPAEQAVDQSPQRGLLGVNVSRMADVVEDRLKSTTAEATLTVKEWRMSLTSKWKKLTD